MSSDTKFFLPGPAYSANVNDIEALLNSVSDGEEVTVTRHKDPFLFAYPPEGGKPVTSYSIYRVRMGDRDPVTVSVLQRMVDIATLNDPDYFGLTDETETPEHAVGLYFECGFRQSDDKGVWINHLLKDLWRSQGGYFMENDGHDAEYDFCVGPNCMGLGDLDGNSPISNAARADGVAKLWTDRFMKAMQKEFKGTLSKDGIEQMRDGFKELASGVIEASLDEKQEAEKRPTRSETLNR